MVQCSIAGHIRWREEKTYGDYSQVFVLNFRMMEFQEFLHDNLQNVPHNHWKGASLRTFAIAKSWQAALVVQRNRLASRHCCKKCWLASLQSKYYCIAFLADGYIATVKGEEKNRKPKSWQNYSYIISGRKKPISPEITWHGNRNQCNRQHCMYTLRWHIIFTGRFVCVFTI